MGKPSCICLPFDAHPGCEATYHPGRQPRCVCQAGAYSSNCMATHHVGEVANKEPLEDAYATFFAKECAAAGMVHASLASLSPLEDLGSLSADELEMVQKARELLLLVHSYILVRADYRVTFLSRVKEVMAMPATASIGIGPVSGGASHMVQGDKDA